MIRALASPKLQHCGLRASLLLSHLHDADDPESARREQRDLLACDIPYFTSATRSSVADLFSRLTEVDRDRQCAILEASFQMIDASSHGIDRICTAGPDAAGGVVQSPRKSHRDRLFDRTDAVMHRDPDGGPSAAWIAPSLHVESDTWGLDTLPVGLMHGQGGVALFLAAVSALDDQSARWSDLARSALQRIVHDVEAGRCPANRGEWLGAFEGGPSAAAALLLVGERIDEPSAKRAGRRFGKRRRTSFVQLGPMTSSWVWLDFCRSHQRSHAPEAQWLQKPQPWRSTNSCDGRSRHRSVAWWTRRMAPG